MNVETQVASTAAGEPNQSAKTTPPDPPPPSASGSGPNASAQAQLPQSPAATARAASDEPPLPAAPAEGITPSKQPSPTAKSLQPFLHEYGLILAAFALGLSILLITILPPFSARLSAACLPWMKFAAMGIAALFAVLTYWRKPHDSAGRLTPRGKKLASLMVLSAFFTISTMLAEENKKGEAARSQKAELDRRVEIFEELPPTVERVSQALVKEDEKTICSQARASVEDEHQLLRGTLAEWLSELAPLRWHKEIDFMMVQRRIEKIIFLDNEASLRAVLVVRKRVLGPEHSEVFESYYSLTLCLKAQERKSEALVFAKRALAGWHKTLGEGHKNTKKAKKLVEDLEKAQ